MAARRILIADDHPAVRRNIRKLLETHPQWMVCGEASDGGEAVEQARRFRPDVVLLDISMPTMNGLEAAREIKRLAPDAQMVVLTTYVADELAGEARRAGAAGVVAKSHAHESLVPTLDALPAPQRTIHLGGSVVGAHRHIAAFFVSEEERYRVLGPFIAEGLAAGEKALHIVDPPDRELYLSRLMEQGIDVDAARADQRLDLLSWEETYLRDGKFDGDAEAEHIEQLLAGLPSERFPRLRLIGNMEWALQDRPGVDHLVDYETQLNQFVPNYPDVVVCAYDVAKFGAAVMIGVIQAHPALVIGGELRDNPFYAAPRSPTAASS